MFSIKSGMEELEELDTYGESKNLKHTKCLLSACQTLTKGFTQITSVTLVVKQSPSSQVIDNDLKLQDWMDNRVHTAIKWQSWALLSGWLY